MRMTRLEKLKKENMRKIKLVHHSTAVMNS